MAALRHGARSSGASADALLTRIHLSDALGQRGRSEWAARGGARAVQSADSAARCASPLESSACAESNAPAIAERLRVTPPRSVRRRESRSEADAPPQDTPKHERAVQNGAQAFSAGPSWKAERLGRSHAMPGIPRGTASVVWRPPMCPTGEPALPARGYRYQSGGLPSSPAARGGHPAHHSSPMRAATLFDRFRETTIVSPPKDLLVGTEQILRRPLPCVLTSPFTGPFPEDPAKRGLVDETPDRGSEGGGSWTGMSTPP